MPGVRKAKINYDDKEAVVTYAPKRATIKAMVAALEKVGFRATFKRNVKK